MDFASLLGWQHPFRPRVSRLKTTLANPGNRTNIPTSEAGSILIPHNSSMLITLMSRTKQDEIWSDRDPNGNYIISRTNHAPKVYWNLSWA